MMARKWIKAERCFCCCLFIKEVFCSVTPFKWIIDTGLSNSWKSLSLFHPGLSEWEHWSYFISHVPQSQETSFLLLHFWELHCMLGNVRAHMHLLTLPLICCHTHTPGFSLLMEHDITMFHETQDDLPDLFLGHLFRNLCLSEFSVFLNFLSFLLATYSI